MDRASSCWDDAAVTYLREQAAKGKSGTEIAIGLQTKGYSHVTRLSVCAKATRLGIALSGKSLPWPEPARAFLRQKAAQNWTSRQISIGLQELGYSYTRKQVSGAAFRFGIKTRHVRANQFTYDGTPIVPKTAEETRFAERMAAAAAVELLTDDDPVMASKPVTCLELNYRHCRWPLGHNADGQRLFCGARHIAGSSYCIVHHNVSRGIVSERNSYGEKEEAGRI